MKLIADTHTHTLASTHAYSTILENAQAAKEAGLCWLGWTDHASPMTDAPHIWHFQNLAVVPETLCGVRILKGVEADISDYQGGLDMPEELLKKMEWVVASVHRPCLPPGSAEEHTAAYIGAARSPYVDVIGHSGLTAYPYDYEAAVKAFREYGKLVEFNQGTFFSRPTAVKNCVEIARICKKLECRVVIDSDAHFAASVGQAPDVCRMLEEVGFPENLVVNASGERFASYLEERAKRVAQAG